MNYEVIIVLFYEEYLLLEIVEPQFSKRLLKSDSSIHHKGIKENMEKAIQKKKQTKLLKKK